MKTTASPIYTKAPSISLHFSSLPSYRASRSFLKFLQFRTVILNIGWSLLLHKRFNKMLTKFCIKSIFLLVAIGFVFGAENYVDYGDETQEKTPVENIHELYKLLMQRSALENAGFDDVPLEHLMIRKSQRSPSLRLRFGRSDPRLSMGMLSRSMMGLPRFNDN